MNEWVPVGVCITGFIGLVLQEFPLVSVFINPVICGWIILIFCHNRQIAATIMIWLIYSWCKAIMINIRRDVHRVKEYWMVKFTFLSYETHGQRKFDSLKNYFLSVNAFYLRISRADVIDYGYFCLIMCLENFD